MTANKLRSRIVFSSIVILIMIALWFVIPRLLRGKDRTPKVNYSLETNGVIRFTDSEEFLSSLVITETSALPIGNHKLSTVGQIVLLIEPGSATTAGRSHPLHLDEKYSEKLGLGKLPWKVGSAFGISEIPTEYKIKAGVPVQVARYGLIAATSRGTVRQILKNPDDPETATVVFEILQGKDWYPGANCKLVFPTLSEKPVAIPKRALLHLGDKDYVFVERAHGEFKLRTVSVIDENDKTMSVTGLSTGERVLAKGSILLKTFIPELLQK
jgi:hypothetical protein